MRVHWSVPLVALALGGGWWEPAAWAGYLAALAAHLLGHAAMARGFGLPVASVEVHGAGGSCRVRPCGAGRAAEPLAVSLGGVLAQAAVAAAAWAVQAALGSDCPAWVEAAAPINASLLVVNLLPLKGLDGAEAWARLRAWHNPSRIVIGPLALRPASASLEDEIAFLEALDRVDVPVSPGVEALLRRLSRSANRQRSGGGRADGGPEG